MILGGCQYGRNDKYILYNTYTKDGMVLNTFSKMVYDHDGNMYKCVPVLEKKDGIVKNINNLQVSDTEDISNDAIKKFIDPYWLHPDDECKDNLSLT